MALRLSTGMRNKLLGGTAGTAGVKALLDGGFIDIYSGSQPASADLVESGTKIVRISSSSGTSNTDGLRFGDASGGVLGATTPVWSGKVTNAAVAGWFRFYGTAGTAGSSNTEVRMDGSVGVSGADLNLTHTNLAVDSTVTITEGNITQPDE